MAPVAARLIEEYTETYGLDREELWFVCTVGLPDEVKESAAKAARKWGFKSIHWVQAQGVITTHGGPAAFGIAGFTRK